MTQSAVTIFVCVSCRRSRADGEYDCPGPELAEAISKSLRDAEAQDITVTPVECLAVCTRPNTIAIVGSEKWTYLVGDLDTDAHLGEIVDAALSYQRSENGIVPWKERPPSFRKGVVARIPPLGFTTPEQKTP